jgi:hypothetical protein
MEVSGQLHASVALPPRERAPGTHWIGGWMGPRAGLDTVSKRKTPSSCRESNPDHPIGQSIASRYTDRAIRALSNKSHHHHHHHHLQGIGQRPVPVQKFNFWTYESIWTFGRTPWTGDQPNARPLPTQDNTTQKKRGHTSMPRAVFEPAIPMFERPKTVRALDRAGIGTG